MQPRIALALLLLAALGLTACPKEDEKAAAAPGASTVKPPASTDEAEPAGPKVDRAELAAFAPLPANWKKAGVPDAVEQQQVALGKMLYFEARLSKNHDVSCNSCHALDVYGVDGEVTSPGHKGQRGGRNSPTTYNAAGHMAQFWDGRAADVEAQALGPILNPVEMALPDEEAALAVLRSMPAYRKAFAAAFPGEEEPLTWAHVGEAIGAFERRLVTPSRFDQLLAGDDEALTAAELTGLGTFVSVGCTACHLGEGLGGSMYQKLGLVKPWPRPADEGRSEVTQIDADKHFFKVPSLRNVAKTAPYFHDGQTAELDEAVRLMARHQLGRELDAGQVAEIVSFLGALTGELPKALIQPPDLPPSSKDTPPRNPS